MKPHLQRTISILLASALLVGLLAAGGCGWYYQTQQQGMAQEAAGLLAAIAQSKVQQSTAWRQKRLADAANLMESPLLTGGLLRYRQNPRPDQAPPGTGGLLTCVDYRHHDVSAHAEPAPDSDWLLMAKIDRSEVLAPWRQKSLLFLGVIFVFLLAGGCLALLVWQKNRNTYYKKLYQAEADLGVAAARHSLILNAIGDAVIAVDAAGRVEMLNPVAAQLTGWEPAEAIGRPLSEVFQIINEETRQPAPDPVARVLQEGVVVGLANHTVLIDRQGGEHSIADSAAPVFAAQGQISGAVLVFRDRTAARLMEKLTEFRLALIHYSADHNLAELLQKTLDEVGALLHSPLGFCHFIDADQRTVSLQQWSSRTVQEFCRVQGYRRHYPFDQAGVWVDCCQEGKPVIYNDYESLSHKKGLPTGHAPLQRLLTVPVLRQGKVVAILGFGNKPSPYTEEDATLVATLADVVWQLISQKRLEEELRQANMLLDSIIENVPHMIFLKDAHDLRFARLNRAGEELLGYSREELLGKSDYDIFPNTEAYVYTARDHEVLRRRELLDIPEEPIQTRHQGQRWLHTKKIPLLGPDGKPLYLLGISEDITEQVRLTSTLEMLAESSSKDADQIFQTLAQETAKVLQVRSALIGRLLPGTPEQVQTLAVYHDGKFLENFSYPLTATPLSLATDQRPAFIPAGVRRLFPEDRFLEKTTAAGYWGLRLTNRAGEAVGILAVSHSQELTLPPQVLSLLEILAARTVAEIERRQAHQALARQQAFLRLVIDAVDAVICVKTLDGRYVLANRALARAYGTTVPELEGRRDEDFCPDLEECRKFRRDDRRVILQRRIVIIPEEQVTFADGSVHWFTTVKRPLLEPDGSCDKLLTVAMDITHRKLTQAEQDRLLAAIEQAGEAIVITDTSGAIQYVNPAFEQITGYRRDEVLGLTPRILKSGQQDQAFYANLWHTITSGLTWRGRMVNRRRDGTLFTEEATISPVFDRNGQIVSFVAVKKNITPELEMERQLYQAQKLESVGRLAGGLAHDFNNMLSVIIGYAELLEKQLPAGHPNHNLVEEIRRAGLRSRALTHQLLAFSRQQSQQLQILDLNMVITTLERMLRRVIGEDIELATELAPNLGAVRVDPGQIEQVLMNLVVNARDAMPAGGRLTIRTRNIHLPDPVTAALLNVPPGPYVMVEVQDTGQGISDEIKDKIFEPFFTTKEAGRGTGLGLSMVYGIIKQSGGDIHCQSKPGAGTTFTFYLPWLEAPAKAQTADIISQVERGSQEHILVVEDEEPLRRLLTHMLRTLNYQATLTADGEEALHLIVEEGLRPDLVITDAVMPRLGGAQLAAELAKILPDLKVIFMSGYVDDRAGPDDLPAGLPFLQKPFSLNVLAAKIREVLGEKSKP